jgi:hypothetical protein
MKILLLLILLPFVGCYESKSSLIDEIANDADLNELIYSDKLRVESLVKGKFGEQAKIHQYMDKLKMDGKSSCKVTLDDSNDNQVKYCELMCKSIQLEKKLISKYGDYYLENYTVISSIFYKKNPSLRLFSHSIIND